MVVAVRTNINWDEFFFLSRIYEQQQGALGQAFQTGYVHLFGWLTHLGESEIDQIIIARLFYYLLLLVSATCLYSVARRFISRSAAIVVGISFFAFSNVLIHGTSFRADGLLLCLFMASLALVVRKPASERANLAAGVLFGTAVFVTIKAVLLALAMLPLLLLIDPEEGSTSRVRRVVAFAGAMLVTLGIAFTIHLLLLGDSSQPSISVQEAGRDMLLLPGFLPQRPSLVQTLLLNPVVWTLLAFGGGVALVKAIQGHKRRIHLQVLALSLPLLSILFYRNSFPYYYIVIVPPALVLLGVAYDTLVSIGRRWRIVSVLMPLLMMIDAIPTLAHGSHDTIERQRRIVEAVHDIFPKPVPYIDGVSMIASYPKVGIFMSAWGMQRYRASGQPIFRDLVGRERPAFLLADASDLEVFEHSYPSERSRVSRLLEEDRDFLASQYTHHWGPVYVPGVRLRLSQDGDTMWETLIPGMYAVESEAAVVINGHRLEPDQDVFLASGTHRLSSVESSVELVLRWNSNLRRPDYPPPETPLFIGF